MRAPVLWILPLLAILSAQWSVAPDVSERRGIALLMTALFGVYLAARYPWKQMLVLLGIGWAILAVGCLISVVIAPSFGIMSEIHVGAWRGLWWEKNTLGGHMARAGFLFACLMLIDPGRRKTWLGFLLLAVFLVAMSTSKTSLLGLLLGFGILAAWAIMRRGPRIAGAVSWLGLAAVGISAFVIIFMPDLLFAVLGRDATLTGRTDIWVALGRQFDLSPWLGHGFGAFWLPDSPTAYYVREETEWPVPTAHNGFLEIVMALGLLGVGLFVIDYAIQLWRASSGLGQLTGLFAFGWLAQMLLFSTSESVFLLQNNILTVTWAAVAAKLALANVRVGAALSSVGVAEQMARPLRRFAGAEAVKALPKGREEQDLAQPLRRPVEPVRPARRAS
jgi:O-antigen ligase